MLVISSDIVLAAAAGELDADLPVIGWHNVVTAEAIVADTAAVNYPASNLANPATHLDWRGTYRFEQYIVITTNETDPIDYVAVAHHNWCTVEMPVSIEGLIEGVWTVLVEEVMLPDDGPALFRFVPRSLAQIRIRLQEGIDIPRAAVLRCGKLLVLERKVYAGHTPLPHGIKSNVANGMSETGNFLGRIVLGEWRESTLPLSLLSPAWFRANMVTFLKAAVEDTFFLAWRPQSYPREVGYCWITEHPAPAPAGPSNLLAFDLKFGGVA